LKIVVIMVFTREYSPVTVRAHGVMTPTIGGAQALR
jgi:hypothetical protein